MKKRYILLVTVFIVNFANAQWQNIGLYYQEGFALAVNGNNLFAATTNGVYLTVNNGNNWTSMNTVTPIFSEVDALAVNGDTIFAGTLGSGIYLSTDNGYTWTQKNTGIIYSNIFSIVKKDSTIFAGCNVGIFKSSNNGDNWVQSGSSLFQGFALIVKDSIIFVGTDYGVVSSTNNGISWTMASTGLPNGIEVHTFLIDSNKIYAGTFGGVYVSTNNGGNWTSLNYGFPVNTKITSFAIKGGFILAGTANNGVYWIAKNGTNWNPLNTGLLNNQILSLAVNNNYLFAGSYEYIWRLPFSDTITTASNSATGGTTLGDGVFIFGQSCTVKASQNSSYVFKNWTDNGTIVSTDSVYTFIVLTGRNLIANFMSTQEIDNNSLQNSVHFYPNPAKDKLIIETSLNTKQNIEIENIVGQTIYTSNIFSKATIDVSTFNKGVYVIKLISNKGTIIKKFIKE